MTYDMTRPQHYKPADNAFSGPPQQPPIPVNWFDGPATPVDPLQRTQLPTAGIATWPPPPAHPLPPRTPAGMAQTTTAAMQQPPIPAPYLPPPPPPPPATHTSIRAKLNATTAIDLDIPHRLDETVQLVLQGRVVRVDHLVEETTGYLYRIETIKLLGTSEVPRGTEL